MITWRRRGVPLGAALSLVALATACERVPLLAPSGSTITLTASASTLPFNGSADIIAQVIEASGTPPHSGTHVTFTTNLGTIQPSEAVTDLSGRVVVKFFAGTASGTATIVAVSGGASVGSNGALKIAIGAAAVGRITIDANPTTVSSSGGTSTITTFVFDINGNPLGGVAVSFATDAGTVSPSTVSADANGKAQTTLTTTKTAKVTATAGSQPSSGGGTGTGSGATTSTQQTATITVTVNAGPSVALTSSTTSPVAGQPVSFTVTPSVASGGNPIQRITVDFGDGSPAITIGSSTATVNHTFNLPGTYTVTATAFDTSGDRGIGTLQLAVGNRPPANVTISASPASPQVGQPVVLTITTTFPTGNTGLVQSVTVDFGDGTAQATLGAQATATVQHFYQTSGSFVVTATVRDTNGGSSTGSTVIIVLAKPNPSVALSSTPNPSTLNQQPVSFTADVTQLPTGVTVDHYEWSFGDGTAARSTTSKTTNHAYTAAGTYTVTVTAVMSDGTRSSSSIEQRVTSS